MIRLDPTPTLLARFARDLLAPDVAALDGLTPDLSPHRPEDVAAAHHAWTERVVDEYRSVVVFAELLQRLGECEAPFDALCAVHTLLGDELRHTALCARAAAWFGPPSRFEVDLAGLALPPSDDPPLVRSLEIVVREIVVAEAESVTSFLAHRDAASDPAARAALSVLFRDEVRHAAAGLALRDTLAAMLPESAREVVLAHLARVEAADRADLRQRYDDAAHGGPGRPFGAAITADDLAAARAKRP
jgi:hypothetical protein